MEKYKLRTTARESEVKTEPLTEFSPNEVATTVISLMLDPSIPATERDAFKEFYVMLSSTMTLSNLKRWELLEWVFAFREICILLDFGDYTGARYMMGEYLMCAQLGRSIDALNMMYGIQGSIRKTTEILEPKDQREEEQKRGLLGKIVSGLRGK